MSHTHTHRGLDSASSFCEGEPNSKNWPIEDILAYLFCQWVVIFLLFIQTIRVLLASTFHSYILVEQFGKKMLSNRHSVITSSGIWHLQAQKKSKKKANVVTEWMRWGETGWSTDDPAGRKEGKGWIHRVRGDHEKQVKRIKAEWTIAHSINWQDVEKGTKVMAQTG